MIEAYAKKKVLKMDMLWVMGEARGIDTTIANYARMAEVPYTIIPALWDLNGKKAGILRNQIMVDFADVVVGFWDGVSPGTKHCLDYARKQNKRIHCFTMNLNK